MGLLCFPEFNQYLVGFHIRSYPQNYPQKIRVSFDALAPNVNIIVTEGLYKGGGFQIAYSFTTYSLRLRYSYY